jgi:hypothetical protein
MLLSWRTKSEYDNLRCVNAGRTHPFECSPRSRFWKAFRLDWVTLGRSGCLCPANSGRKDYGQDRQQVAGDKSQGTCNRELQEMNIYDTEAVMDMRPALSFSNRLSLREFEAEVWKLYFGFVKGLLTAVTSLVYLLVLTAFFIAQHAALIVGRVTGWVVDWSPEKPRVFGMRPANGE